MRINAVLMFMILTSVFSFSVYAASNKNLDLKYDPKTGQIIADGGPLPALRDRFSIKPVAPSAEIQALNAGEPSIRGLLSNGNSVFVPLEGVDTCEWLLENAHSQPVEPERISGIKEQLMQIVGPDLVLEIDGIKDVKKFTEDNLGRVMQGVAISSAKSLTQFRGKLISIRAPNFPPGAMVSLNASLTRILTIEVDNKLIELKAAPGSFVNIVK